MSSNYVTVYRCRHCRERVEVRGDEGTHFYWCSHCKRAVDAFESEEGRIYADRPGTYQEMCADCGGKGHTVTQRCKRCGVPLTPTPARYDEP